MQLIQTPVDRRRYSTAILVGILAGAIGAIVKFVSTTVEKGASNDG